MELKEKKSVDELLKMHSRFLQVSVTSALTWRLSIITHNYHLYNLYYYQKGPKSQTKLQFVYQVLSGLGVIRSLICSAWPQLWKRTLLTSLMSSLRRLSPRPPEAARRDATRPPRSGRVFIAPSLSLRQVSSSLSALPPRLPAWETMLYQKVTFVLLGNTREVNRIRRQRRSREGELEGSN